MNILQKTLELDIAYLESFTKHIPTSWGSYFYNEDHPKYYDANHAHISKPPEDSKEVIEEVIDFYNEKNLIPRFYLYDYDNFQDFSMDLKSYGFQVEELNASVQLWNNEIYDHQNNPLVTIEKVTNQNFTKP